MSDTVNTNFEAWGYADLKPFYASQHGCCRLFTANYNGKKVIVKTLKEKFADDGKYKEALRNEYEMTSVLNNKYIRKAIDFVNISGLGDCIIFEYINGKTLSEHVRVGTLSVKQVKNILVEVCDALNYMHRNRLVHGNLKPENILITEGDFRTRIIDLGVPTTDPRADRELLIKEMEFVSPEIIKGEDFDVRSDIYSVGKIMEFINERNISKQFNSIATHCTQFSREQRYDSIAEVRSAITKGYSFFLFVGLAVVAVVAVVFACVFVPRMKENVAREKAERMAVDFDREVKAMQDELPALCEKYRLTSLDQPIAASWAADSARFMERFLPFFAIEDYQPRTLEALNSLKMHIDMSRQADFDRLLLQEFKHADDSLALQLKQALPVLSDSALSIEAEKWFNQAK